jgi:hypothetical protein
MTARQRLAYFLVFLTAGLALSGCGGGSKSSEIPPPPAGDFSITANPNAVSLAQGAQGAAITLSVAAIHGLSGNVTVAIAGLPAGVTSSPAAPLTVAVGSSASVTFSAATSATLGPAIVNFQGSQGSLSHSASAAVNISPFPDFGLAVQPGSVSLVQGASQPVNLLATPLNGFSGNIAVSIAGLPAGVSAPSALQLTPGTVQSVTLSAANSAAPGTANLSFQGTSGSLSHSANATLQVQAAVTPDFSIAVSPGMVALKQGSHSDPLSVSVTGLNGFSGDVTVSLSGLPAGVLTSSPSLTIAAGSSSSVTLSAPLNVKPGSSTVTFQGTSGSLSHAANASVNVIADAVFSTTYFFLADSVVPDETVRVVNPGIQSTPSTLGTMCANIYVFDQSQELKECCSCPVTANGTLRLSVNKDLTANPGNGKPFFLGQGTLSVIPGTVPSTGLCDASNVSPAPDLSVWATHIGFGAAPTSTGLSTSGVGVIESEAADLSLSGTQMTNFISLCGFIESNDSGTGICTCGTGDMLSGAGILLANN